MSLELSLKPIPEDLSWRERIINSKGDYAWPQSVSVEGDVSEVKNPVGILRQGGEEAVMTSAGDGSSRIIVDFGKLTSGFVELGVKSATGGPIRMAYAEWTDFLGKWGDGDTAPDSNIFQYGTTYGPDDDPDGRADLFPPPIITPTNTYTVLISPGIRGSQRFVAVSLDGPGTAVFDFIRVRQTNYCGRYDGHFLCSDEALTAAWYASAYAIDLSTVRDNKYNPDATWVIIDGPKRDRLVYNYDLRVVGLAAYCMGIGYHEIMRDSLNLFAFQQWEDGSFPCASRVDVPNAPYTDPGEPKGSPEGFEPPGDTAFGRLDSFTAWWVIQLDDYLLYTGDIEFARPLMQVARRAIKFFENHREEGSILWRTDGYDEFFPVTWHSPDCCIGVDVFGNIGYYGALRSMARLERVVAGDEAAAAGLDHLAEQVKKELLEKYWDEEAGAMLLNSESPVPDHPSDSNMGALLFDLLDEERSKRVIRHLTEKLGTPFGTLNSEYDDNIYMTQYISPPIMAQEAVARFAHGDGKGALDLIRKAWGHMIENGPGTPWEEIGAAGDLSNARPEGTQAGEWLSSEGFLCLAHAWSTPIPALNMHVLGVAPMENGYAAFSVAPKPVDLAWAQGAVPTPEGYINVRWALSECNGSFALTVLAPEKLIGSIAVPLMGGSRDIAIDGKMAWENGAAVNGFAAGLAGDAVVFSGMRGDHTYAWSE
ncbi:MAG: hypothetical protein FWG03_03120 [Clostridiales bacterium]|nr:hypothetical protein [Clostridiales bacterium]